MGAVIVIVMLLVVAIAAVAWFWSVQRRRVRTIDAPAPAPVATSLAERLARTRAAVGGRIGALLRGDLDESVWTELEEALVSADVGVSAAAVVIGRVRAANPADADAAHLLLRQQLIELFAGRDRNLNAAHHPIVIIVVGVNGSGKTTVIAKLAARYRALGATPLLAAADTFRAAADEQLRTWAQRVGVDVVGGAEGADPASVAVDAVRAAKARRCDVVIVDTAGRLHSNANLMSELSKVVRVVTKEAGAVDEVLLVLDGTGGQNGIAQSRSFLDSVGVTGIVITKLDGTARGGIAVAVERELDIPVKLVGIGEGVEDLVPFVPTEFVDALLGT